MLFNLEISLLLIFIIFVETLNSQGRIYTNVRDKKYRRNISFSFHAYRYTIEINSKDNTAVKKYVSINPLILKFSPQIYITKIEAVYFSAGIS